MSKPFLLGPLPSGELSRRTFLKVCSVLVGGGLPLAVWTSGCGVDLDAGPEGAIPVEALRDGGRDAPPFDLASDAGRDAGARDAGARDAGTPDAGTPDVGTADVGTADVGSEGDAGPVDVGAPDVGAPDVGAPDIGAPDVGFDCGRNLCLALASNPALQSAGGSVLVQGAPNGDTLVVARTVGTAFIALSAVCTHAGCTVSYGSRRLSCPCHGSEFAEDGTVTTGPAFRPLTRYAVSFDGSTVYVAL